jgi:hypothetical protein
MANDKQILTGMTEEVLDPAEELLEYGINRKENQDGSTEFEFIDRTIIDQDGINIDEIDHYENLVEYLTQEDLTMIAEDVLDTYMEDEASREGHISALVQGIDQLGLDDTDVDTPFDGACTVFHPLIMERGTTASKGTC